MELIINDYCHVTYSALTYNDEFSHIENTSYFISEKKLNVCCGYSISLAIYLRKSEYTVSKGKNILRHLPFVNNKHRIGIYKDIILMYFKCFYSVEPNQLVISHEHNEEGGMCYLCVCVVVKEVFATTIEPFQISVKDLNENDFDEYVFIVMRMKERTRDAVKCYIKDKIGMDGVGFFVFDENDMQVCIKENKEENTSTTKTSVIELNSNSNCIQNYNNTNKKQPLMKCRSIQWCFISKIIKRNNNVKHNVNNAIISNNNNNNTPFVSDLSSILNETNTHNMHKQDNDNEIDIDASNIQSLLPETRESIFTQYPLIDKWFKYYVLPRGLRKRKILFIFISQRGLNISPFVYNLFPREHTLSFKNNFKQKPMKITSPLIKHIYFSNINTFPSQLESSFKNITRKSSKKEIIKGIQIFKTFFFNLSYSCIITTTNINFLKVCYTSPLINSCCFFQEIPNTNNSFNKIETDFNISFINSITNNTNNSNHNNKNSLLLNKKIKYKST